MSAKQVLDFIYLDLPRLESIASQLLEGLPESHTKSRGHESDIEAEISGGVPFVAKGSAGTRAIFSAASSVTSRYHHRLVVEVLERLRAARFLYGPDEDPPDGAFVQLSGELQVVDPRLLSKFMESAPDLQAAERAFGNSTTAPQRNKADRRARRGTDGSGTGWPARSQTESITKLLDIFTGDTARIRVIVEGQTVAVGVVERDKFVEDLERLVGRHGQLFGGQWSVLGQANAPGDEAVEIPKTSNIFDLIESSGAKLVGTLTQLTGSGTSGLQLTPLAIYRTILPKE